MTKEEYEIEHTYDAPTENLCKFFEPNPNQDRIKRLQIIKKELESVQEWHKENDKQKNEHVKFKISVCLSLIEFLKYGKCDTHKALLPNALIFNNNPYPAVNMGIEDIHSREVVSFVRNLAEVAFEDYYGYIVWSTHPSRRVNREKLYTNAVKLAVVDVTTNVDLMTFDLKNYYGKRLDIDLSSIQMENVDKLNVHIIAYSRGGDIVIKHENLELTKENNIQIDIPDIMKDL